MINTDMTMTNTSASLRISKMVQDPGSVDTAIESRLAVRAFLPKPVPRETIEEILTMASRAASGSNTQPWKVYILQGKTRVTLVEKVRAAQDAIFADPGLDGQSRGKFEYYPEKWMSPYIDRRRENGWALYGMLGITKGDKEKMQAQRQRNFEFFGAPVGLMFTLDTFLGRGALLDYGMFLQTIMLAARARGLHTCPQAAWTEFAKVILPHLNAGENEMLVCGMSLGYADEADKVNEFDTPRLPVEQFCCWLD
jgi:nitroreductase